MTTPAQSQLIAYLRHVHALEQSALVQLRTGVETAGNAPLREALRDHLKETAKHEQLISARLEFYDESPSTLKDLAQKGEAALTGAFSKIAPDSSVTLAVNAYALEHLEIATYQTLRVAAERASDSETVTIVDAILREEEAAAQKLGSLLEQVAQDDLQRHMAEA